MNFQKVATYLHLFLPLIIKVAKISVIFSPTAALIWETMVLFRIKR